MTPRRVILVLTCAGLSLGGAAVCLLATFRLRNAPAAFAAWKRGSTQVGNTGRWGLSVPGTHTEEGAIETNCPGLIVTGERGEWVVRHQPSGLKVAVTRYRKDAKTVLLELCAAARQHGRSWDVPVDRIGSGDPNDEFYVRLRAITEKYPKP